MDSYRTVEERRASGLVHPIMWMPETYLCHAQEAERLAADSVKPEERLALLGLASEWRRRADRAAQEAAIPPVRRRWPL